MGRLGSIMDYVPQLNTNINSLYNSMVNLESSMNGSLSEVNRNIINVYKYMIVLSASLLVCFIITMIIMLVKSGKKIATISQNSFIIHGKKFKYIPLNQISKIEKYFFGINITLVDGNIVKLLLVENPDQIISFYNQMLVFAK